MKRSTKACIFTLLMSLVLFTSDIVQAEVYPHTSRGTLVWSRIDSDARLPSGMERQEVKDWVRRYMRAPKNLTKGLTRAEPYIYMFMNEVEARGLPSEFALLPMVESMYETTANSHMGAGGIWQIIRPTGRRFGLLQDSYYDGRFDVQASTQAALDYLVFLGQRYNGDWLLAAAAYNCGEGNVDKAIRRNKAAGKKTDFWSLNLPRETRGYVPKLLAVKEIVAHPERYNIQLPQIMNKPYITHIDIGNEKSLAQVAALVDLSLDEIISYNPGYHQLITHPSGPSHIILPISHAKVLKSKMHCLNARSAGSPTYVVKKGDTLGKIAGTAGTTVAAIKKTNRLASDTIRIGQELVLPA